MTKETAKEAIDFLFRESGDQEKLAITFFGGEPLMNMDIIRFAVQYGRKTAEKTGKQLSLSVTTNGTLLTKEIADYLIDNRVSVLVSIDGPKEQHDKMRVFPDGSGSHDTVIANVKKIMKRRKKGRISAEFTFTLDQNHISSIRQIVNYLTSLGFERIHGELDFKINDKATTTQGNIEKLKSEYKKVAKLFLRNARNMKPFNLSTFATRVGRVQYPILKMYRCGAGRNSLAVGVEGNLFPCHAFQDNEEFLMGNVSDGIDTKWQRKFIENYVDNRPSCKKCWARYLCQGGCFYQGHLVNGDWQKPSEVHCEIEKYLWELAIATYANLSTKDKENLQIMYEERYGDLIRKAGIQIPNLMQ